MRKIIILLILCHFSLLKAEDKKSSAETGATIQSNLSAELQNGKKKTDDLWVSTRFFDYNWVLYSWTIPTL